jgi:hypothetical protein
MARAAHAHVWTQASLAREMTWSRAGHVEQGRLDVAAPVIGEKQVRTPVVLGQISLRKKL